MEEEAVPKRTSFGSGPHKNQKLDEEKGRTRKIKHKKKQEDQDA